MRTATWLTISLSTLALGLSSPEDAHACGGTFCDSGPTAMPVDQSGENILFVMDGTTVEAHVQIQYQGAAERFAWIVPMQKIPEVTVGSQLLFQNLLQGTVPSYGFNVRPDACPTNGSGGSTSADAGFNGSGGSAGSAGGGGGGPTVVYQKTVGAFEVVALEGGTAQEVSDWLVANQYQTIPNAPAILADYVAKGFVFVALKMTAGADVSEIHPLVFKYEGTEPCVPIKLTAVAATEDMGLRVFFLGDDRAVPLNYKHITLNPTRIDWLNFGSNYNQVISRAADSAIANGKAFVTEYAGASSVVSTFSVYSPSWNAEAFSAIAPEAVVDQLEAQNLMLCYPGFCQYNHPLLQGLLQKYLPIPTGLTEDAFYDCLSCYKDQIDTTVWNSAQFAADMQARIVDPGLHAVGLLGKWPYLTRMFTTISPAEMTEDPIFYTRPNLPAVPPSGLASQRVTCSGERAMILPDGREVALGSGTSSWPAFDSDMPWVEEVSEFPEGKDPIVLVDNTDKIDLELKQWNDAQGWPPAGSGSGGSVGSGGSGSGTGASANGAEGNSAAGGCACGVAGKNDERTLLFGLAVLGLAILRRGRRR